MKDTKRYSMAFKLKVMEELRDGKWKTVSDAAQAYGVSVHGVHYWMERLGFKHLNGRIIYVKTATEIDEIKRLKAEVRRLKEQLEWSLSYGRATAKSSRPESPVTFTVTSPSKRS